MKKILIILIVLFILSIGGWLLLNRQQSQKISISKYPNNQVVTISPTPVVSAEDIIKHKYGKLLELKRGQGDGLSQVAAIENQDKLDPKAIAELNKLDDFMRTEGTTYSDVEIVTIFFDNIPNARYSYEERKDRALEAVNQLRDAISKGDIPMAQAASKLKTRPDISDIDTAWETNAYSHMPFAKKKENATVDNDINALVWSLPVGELSQPQIFQYENSQNTESSKIDVGYMLVKVNKREQKEFDSYYDFMKAD